MADCSVCGAPALPGGTLCEKHAPVPAEEIPLPVFPVSRGADPGRTEVLRLDDLMADAQATQMLRLPSLPAPTGKDAPLDPQATAVFRVDAPPPEDATETHRALPRLVLPAAEPDAQATAMIRLPVPEASTDPAASPVPAGVPAVSEAITDPSTKPVAADAQATAMIRLPSLAAAAESPDPQATAMFRLPVPEAVTDPSTSPIPNHPDAQATATFRPPPADEATATARALPRLVLPTGPDAQATAMTRLPAVSPENPAFPDSQPTAMSRASEPPKPPSEDLVATSMTRVPAPAPTAPTAPVLAPVPPAPRPKRQGNALGRVLGGRFEVKTHLGSGGFGATYVAWDQRLKRECVIKILRPLSDPPSPFEVELRKRFSNEALTMAHLTHPNITQVFDHGEEGDGAAWIAMEFVRGRSLADIGREEKQLEPQRVARLGAQIASALAFAHSRGIVHRDLKPDNILVVENQTGGEQVKVLDFGIARITDPSALGLDQSQAQLTNIGAFLGTPAFMSPEQAEGAPVGPASDVYSLGVVLYLLVTGRLPGSVPSAWNPMTTIVYVTSPFEPIRRLVPTCPPLVAETIEQMLVKETHKRTLSAAQVEKELQSLAPTTYQRGGAVAMPAQKRNVWPALAIGAVVVAIGAIVALQLTKKQVKQAEQAAQIAQPVAPPAPVVDQRAIREGKLATLLQRARAGEGPEAIDPVADELAKTAPDARLELAKGLARVTAKDLDGAIAHLQAAVDLGGDSPVGREAEQQKAAVVARKAAEAEAAAKAARKEDAAKKKDRPVAERPEY